MEQNIFEQLGQTLRDGVDAMQDYLQLLRSAGSAQTVRGDIAAVSEIMKAVGSTSDRLQRLLANDGAYMSEFEALELFKAYGDDAVEAIEFGLSLSSLTIDEQKRIRNAIVDDLTARIPATTNRHAEWRVSRRKHGYTSTERLPENEQQLLEEHNEQ